MNNKSIEECFYNSPFKSIKHKSYFPTYENLFNKFIDKEIVFVEVGVLNGGSLFMWRDYFGKKAKIIGIDNNPNAKQWEKYGFEIFIGDQSDSNFWKLVQSKIGKFDILLDDGGHLDYQQSATFFENINNMNNNGLIVIEDTHASYMQEFGNPNKYSFMNLVFHLIDKLNYRSSTLNKNLNYLKIPISDIHIFESIVCFKINKKNSAISHPVENHGKDLKVKDLRFENKERHNINNLIKKLSFLKKIPFFGKLIYTGYTRIFRNKFYNLIEKYTKKKK